MRAINNRPYQPGESPLLPASGSRRHTTTRRRFAYAAATILLCSLTSYAANVLPVFRDSLQTYFGIGEARFGLLLSIGLVPGALAGIAGGVLADRWGPRAVLRWGLLGSGLAMCLAAVGTRYGLMVAAVVLLSVSICPAYIALQPYLVNLFPGQRRRVLSLSLVWISVMGILYALCAEHLLELHQQREGMDFAQVLHVPFALLAAPMLLGALLYRRRKRLGPHRPEADKRRPLLRLSFRPGTWMLIAMGVLHMTADCAAFNWLPRVLDSASFARQVFKPGHVLAAYGAAYVLSRALLAVLPERVGRRLMLVAPGMLGGAAFLVGVFSRSQALTSAGYVLGAFLWSAEYPAIMATIVERDRANFGSALAVMTLISSAAGTVLTYCMGLMGNAVGESRLWMILPLPACLFPLVGVCGLLWLLKHGATDAPEKEV